MTLAEYRAEAEARGEIGLDDIWSKTEYIHSLGRRTVERDGYRLEQLGLECQCPNCSQFGHWHTQKREALL